jgi:radical SAM protein with 4Fe4S-binding SPASM domain
VPLFSRVELETQNRCNGVCSFCPANKNADTRPYAKMTGELYEKIIDELHELNYSGGLSLFCNNEPFLDTRLEEFAKIARERLPKARIEIFSNGTILKLERFIKIIPFLDLLVIDNYSDNLKWHEPVKILREYIKYNPEHKSKVKIRMRKESAIMSTRGGQAPNNSKKKTLPISCLLPFYHMVIRPDGKISLCCNDAMGKYTLGDASKQSLKDIWYGDIYSDVREKIKEGRDTIDLCKYCDSYANTAMLHLAGSGRI